ncbi:MAG: hypothetical protein GX793_00945 [Bacteroidales bacterium]|jgi:hypothetical protein|nr:hypothetical protein [Bacteroidales bacterium]MCK9498055.1 hypothetical protein [Bacteroidales bacterium]MDY0314285.1 hypothetical protein [Bacteroidales bacterium]NLB85607.1 hypothetical protein [Bacteroidales bacterium]
MKNNKFLLPYYLKYAGFIIFGIGFTLFVLEIIEGTNIKDFIHQTASINIYAIYAVSLLGLVLICFSKERESDEYIEHIKLKSLLSSVFVHSFFFFIFSFTNLTLSFINFPAILLMNSILVFYLIFYYIYKIKS